MIYDFCGFMNGLPMNAMRCNLVGLMAEMSECFLLGSNNVSIL